MEDTSKFKARVNLTEDKGWGQITECHVLPNSVYIYSLWKEQS